MARVAVQLGASFAVFTALATGNPGVHAADPPEAPGAPAAEAPADPAEAKRLKDLQDKIEALRSRLVAAEAQAGTLLDDLDEMGLRQALLTRESEMLRRETAAAGEAVIRARRDAAAAQERVGRAERDLREWIVEMYKTGTPPSLGLLLLAGSPSELATAERSAEALAATESRRVETLRVERVRLDAAVAERQKQEERLVSLQGELDLKRQDLVAAQASKGKLLQDIRTRQGSEEQALQGMVQMERDLTALLGRVGDETSPSRGMENFRGLLGWPVQGPVAIPFGNVRHPKFHTQVPHQGLEIACDPGTEVRALFEGKVVFSDWLRGYGEMIVIDHGGEYLSVYGQLGERLAAAGQEVRRDDVIARSGPEGPWGMTGLYLEIRRHGEPLDPLPWLRQSGRRSSVTEKKK
ncbi:MAG TPA: peptidoglycan DD-metalloendopeptidase family protein [Verrucomicrobiae bacterium]|nr:peptidoglycan DD-metalloendopeptidase family protein [Verrucomicrobiae bacterium]